MQLSILDELAKIPGGRGEFSVASKVEGKQFRKKSLLPALKKATKNDPLIVDITGTIGYGAAFLEGAFGGLVSEENYSIEDLHRKLRIEYGNWEVYKDIIWDYINHAATKHAA